MLIIKIINKRSLLSLCFLSLMFLRLYAQSFKPLTLDDVLNVYCLQSNEAKSLELNKKISLLTLENFELAKLPSVSFNFNPLNFSQSIVSLQDPISGNFHYTNSYNNTTNTGIFVKQPINLLGGSLQLSTSLNILNEFSTKKNTFSTTPMRISYNQPLFGGGKLYKFDSRLNKLKKENLDISTKAQLYSIQKKCVELYMNALAHDLLKKNSEINLSIADSVLKISNAKKLIGEIKEQDYLQSEIQYEQSFMEVANRRIQYDKTLRELVTYLNLSPRRI